MRQVIRILLDNALTHTPEGTKVTVTTYSANGRAELTVSDEGPGIPQRVQKRIFERFYTADSAGGSGLGLAIASELAQRMEGEITISSSRRFTAFTLDLPPGPRGGRAAPAPAPRPGRRREAAASASSRRCVCLALLAGCGSGGGDSQLDGRAAVDRHRRRRSQAGTSARRWRSRPSSPASTPPASTARPRPGVVTIRSIFAAAAAPPRARASSSTTSGEIVTNAHVVTDESSGDAQAGQGSLHRVPRPQHRPGQDRRLRPLRRRRPAEGRAGRLRRCTRCELGDDNDLVVGQPVAAIGSPFGEQQSLSVGVVSATDRSVESLTQFQIYGAIQTDASINPGNSGGPLLDAGARVIGINQQIETNSGANDGVGFAVPISAIKRSVAQLREDGEAEYAYIGVSSQPLYPQLAAQARPRHRPTAACSPKSSPAARPRRRGSKGGDDKAHASRRPSTETGGDVILADRRPDDRRAKTTSPG